jgi:hypothetical protein
MISGRFYQTVPREEEEDIHDSEVSSKKSFVSIGEINNREKSISNTYEENVIEES